MSDFVIFIVAVVRSVPTWAALTIVLAASFFWTLPDWAWLLMVLGAVFISGYVPWRHEYLRKVEVAKKRESQTLRSS